MKKTKGKKRRLPKPVTRWWFIDSDGNLEGCLSRTRYNAEWRLHNSNRYMDGYRIVRVRITPITPKPKRRAKR